MFLTYIEYSPPFCTNNRTNKTSFQYTKLGAEGQPVIGRVKAVADGALILKTNKAKDDKKYCIWSKQRYAISFEVQSYLIQG
jgi:hypothetical protein